MGASVLIIDADEAFADEVATALRTIGVEASTTGDGKLGLDLARINLPSAIVLCVELPRMSGYSVCAKLKKDDALKSVPVVITSSEATPETFEQHRKLKSRAEEYVKKPVEAPLIVTALAPYLGLEGAPQIDADDSEDIAILDDELSVDDSPSATLGDDEAFSVEEAQALHSDAASPADPMAVPDLAEDQDELDLAFRALSEPAGTPQPPAVRPDDEALTTIALMPPPHDSEVGELRAQTANMSSVGVMAQELESLRARVIELDEATTMAESERDAARVELEQALRSSQPPISGSVISSRDALALKKQRNALEREVLGLKEQLQAKEKDQIAWHEREEELEARVVELEEALTRAGDESAATQAVLLGEQAKVAESQRSSQELKRRVAELSEQLEAKEAALLEANDTIATANAGLATAQAVIAEKDQQLIAKADEAAGLHTRIGALQAEAETALEELDIVQAQSAAHEKASDEAAQQLGALRAQSAGYEKAAAEANSSVAQLQEELRNTAAEMGRLTNELEGASAEATNLRQQIGAKSEEITALNQRVVELDEEDAALKAQTAELQARITASEAERATAEGHLSDAYSKIREDNIIRGKAMKAIEIAMALVQEAGFDDEFADEPVPGDDDEPVDTEAPLDVPLAVSPDDDEAGDEART